MARRLAVRDMQNSIKFNSSTDEVAWVDGVHFDFTNITVETWVRFPFFDPAFRDIVIKWNAVSVPNQSFAVTLTPTGEFAFYIRVGGTSYNIDSGIIPQLGRWYHLVSTYDGTDLKTYVNGTAEGTPVTVGGSIDTGTSELRLGNREDGSTGADMHMSLCRIFSNAATAAQVADLYYDNQTFETPVLEALMTEGSGTSIASTGSHTSSGTMTNVDWSTASPFKPRTAIT